MRASAGTAFALPLITASADDAVDALTARGGELLVASADGTPVAELGGPGAGLRALVVGNEGAGVRHELRAVARDTISVPMRGPAESLNVAVAGSVLMYALGAAERPGRASRGA